MLKKKLSKYSNFKGAIVDVLEDNYLDKTYDLLPDEEKIMSKVIDIDKMGKSFNILSKDLLDNTANLSSFDVGMSFIASNLSEFSEKMSDISMSNMAVSEENHASMDGIYTAVDKTAENLDSLTKETTEIGESSHDSLELLSNIEILKDETLTHSNHMNKNIEELVPLIQGILKIIEDVKNIANQTNLLALNAAIKTVAWNPRGMELNGVKMLI